MARVIMSQSTVNTDDFIGKTWERQIKNLMADFCIPTATINQIIKETKQEVVNHNDYARLYNTAWRKFKVVICA